MIEITSIFILLSSIFIIVKAADFIIKAISNISKEFGITEYFLGFVIVAFGTSIPELATAIFGSIAKKSNLILGNLIGASILDITLVLGVIAIIGKHIKIEGKMFRTFDQTLFMTLGMVLLPFILGLNGKFSRLDGIILLIAFGFYLFMLIEREKKFRHIKRVVLKDIHKDIIILVISISALLFGAKFLVDSAIDISASLNVSPFIIGILVVSIGTTMPELTIGMRSVIKRVKNIGLGEVIGSIITNMLLVLGIAALINPFVFDKRVFISSALFLITLTFVGLLFLQKKIVTWKEGFALIFLYITFLISEVIFI